MTDEEIRRPKDPGEEQLEAIPAKEEAEVEALGAAVEEPGAEVEPGTMKVDLHCHSEASADCMTSLKLMPARCLERDIRVQAITDHNEIWGAQQLKALVESGVGKAKGRLTIIVGEEISTTEGEIIGLFLKECIPRNLSPEETVAAIKEQGGLVLLPHGFDPLKRYRLRPTALERVAADIDIVETFNARVSRPRWNQSAVEWSKQMGTLMSAGSDAHTMADIGSAWVEVPLQPIKAPLDLLDALEGGTPVGEWTHPVLAFMYKMWAQLRSRVQVLRS